MHHAHHLELTVGPEPTVIDRVVGVCRERRCRIVGLHYVAADAHAPGVVRLAVVAPPARVRLLGDRLAGLVDVRAVDRVASIPRVRPASHDAHAARRAAAERRR
jgi:acetolactate synthase regulatory subunit